jgi:hypothetical protein
LASFVIAGVDRRHDDRVDARRDEVAHLIELALRVVLRILDLQLDVRHRLRAIRHAVAQDRQEHGVGPGHRDADVLGGGGRHAGEQRDGGGQEDRRFHDSSRSGLRGDAPVSTVIEH